MVKPPGMSSHDVIDVVRRIFKQKRVGHAGTLDPAAAGVLPVALGRAARLIEYMEIADKSYRAELSFGCATDTGDVYGTVTESLPAFSFPPEDVVIKTLVGFIGTIDQRPPAHSAIKIGGKRAYNLARSGAGVEIPVRRVEIYGITFLEYNPARHSILFDVDCSKGTYIRTLCMDIGAKLGLPALLRFLLRTRVGEFYLSDSYTLEELANVRTEALCTLDEVLGHIPRYELDPARVKAFYSGLSTTERNDALCEGLYRVYSGSVFLGIGRYDAAAQEMYPEKAFPPL
ncbi:MAG: tRNA pseudouridine(55) synthase TruB [Selenomonas artemidis]